ncbi:hypothetical protein C9994_09185 [Marivirga lumbricoides]|uniref:Uncharacterized protein n=1 Tax=Marivirga lumbricoides TaxID=1046115 RepID=A0A2T4DQE8_9BACT|nr:hypothetical protein C9994_09185 [Marivirga lumbricoides]
MSYSIKQHKHNFAIWTAARAAQRGYASTEVIGEAIKASDLQNFAEKPEVNSQEEFDVQHKVLANQIMKSLESRVIPCTYGRAAKIIAIYLKTFVIIDQSNLAKGIEFIHPPIDRILLHNLHNEVDNTLKLNNYSWTKIEENKYFELIEKLKTLIPEGKPFWYLEKDWSVE